MPIGKYGNPRKRSSEEEKSNDSVHWSQVIDVSSKQSKYDQKFSEQILDFWQQHYPQVFSDIASTAEYRQGKKVEFGFDVLGKDSTDSFTHSSSIKSDKLFVVNLSKDQSKGDGFISHRTGIFQRFSIEGTALHELTHAGDKRIYTNTEKSVEILNERIPHLKILLSDLENKGFDVKDGQEALDRLGNRSLPGNELESIGQQLQSVLGSIDIESYKPSKEALSAGKKLAKLNKEEEKLEKESLRLENWTVGRVDKVISKYLDPDRKRGDYNNGVDTTEKDKEFRSFVKGNINETFSPEKISEFRNDLNQIINLSREHRDGKTVNTESLNNLMPAFQEIAEIGEKWDQLISKEGHLITGSELPKGFYANAAPKTQKRMADDFSDIEKDALRTLKELGELEEAMKSGDQKEIRSEKKDLSKRANNLFEEIEQAQGKNSKLLSSAKSIESDLGLNLNWGEKPLTVKEAIRGLTDYGIEVQETKDPNHFIVGNYLVNSSEVSIPK